MNEYKHRFLWYPESNHNLFESDVANGVIEPTSVAFDQKNKVIYTHGAYFYCNSAEGFEHTTQLTETINQALADAENRLSDTINQINNDLRDLYNTEVANRTAAVEQAISDYRTALDLLADENYQRIQHSEDVWNEELSTLTTQLSYLDGDLETQKVLWNTYKNLIDIANAEINERLRHLVGDSEVNLLVTEYFRNIDLSGNAIWDAFFQQGLNLTNVKENIYLTIGTAMGLDADGTAELSNYLHGTYGDEYPFMSAADIKQSISDHDSRIDALASRVDDNEIAFAGLTSQVESIDGRITAVATQVASITNDLTGQSAYSALENRVTEVEGRLQSDFLLKASFTTAGDATAKDIAAKIFGYANQEGSGITLEADQIELHGLTWAEYLNVQLLVANAVQAQTVDTNSLTVGTAPNTIAISNNVGGIVHNPGQNNTHGFEFKTNGTGSLANGKIYWTSDGKLVFNGSGGSNGSGGAVYVPLTFKIKYAVVANEVTLTGTPSTDYQAIVTAGGTWAESGVLTTSSARYMYNALIETQNNEDTIKSVTLYYVRPEGQLGATQPDNTVIPGGGDTYITNTVFNNSYIYGSIIDGYVSRQDLTVDVLGPMETLSSIASGAQSTANSVQNQLATTFALSDGSALNTYIDNKLLSVTQIDANNAAIQAAVNNYMTDSVIPNTLSDYVRNDAFNGKADTWAAGKSYATQSDISNEIAKIGGYTYSHAMHTDVDAITQLIVGRVPEGTPVELNNEAFLQSGDYLNTKNPGTGYEQLLNVYQFVKYPLNVSSGWGTTSIKNSLWFTRVSGSNTLFYILDGNQLKVSSIATSKLANLGSMTDDLIGNLCKEIDAGWETTSDSALLHDMKLFGMKIYYKMRPDGAYYLRKTGDNGSIRWLTTQESYLFGNETVYNVPAVDEKAGLGSALSDMKQMTGAAYDELGNFIGLVSQAVLESYVTSHITGETAYSGLTTWAQNLRGNYSAGFSLQALTANMLGAVAINGNSVISIQNAGNNDYMYTKVLNKDYTAVSGDVTIGSDIYTPILGQGGNQLKKSDIYSAVDISGIVNNGISNLQLSADQITFSSERSAFETNLITAAQATFVAKTVKAQRYYNSSNQVLADATHSADTAHGVKYTQEVAIEGNEIRTAIKDLAYDTNNGGTTDLTGYYGSEGWHVTNRISGDGSGYLANGNIYWNSNGRGRIGNSSNPGITWNENGEVTVTSITAGNSGTTTSLSATGTGGTTHADSGGLYTETNGSKTNWIKTDGSGFLASLNISWDSNGSVEMNNITLGSQGVKAFSTATGLDYPKYCSQMDQGGITTTKKEDASSSWVSTNKLDRSGSGFLANGNILWDKNGNIVLKNYDPRPSLCVIAASGSAQSDPIVYDTGWVYVNDSTSTYASEYNLETVGYHKASAFYTEGDTDPNVSDIPDVTQCTYDADTIVIVNGSKVFIPKPEDFPNKQVTIYNRTNNNVVIFTVNKGNSFTYEYSVMSPDSKLQETSSLTVGGNSKTILYSYVKKYNSGYSTQNVWMKIDEALLNS